MTGDQPDIRTVVFADFCESSKLLSDRGDLAGMACLNTALDFMSRLIAEQGGVVHDRIGDEIFGSFDRPEVAAGVTMAIHRNTRDAISSGYLDPRTRFRIGLHSGSVLMENGMPQGDTVHTARRMANQSKPEQIILSEETARMLHAPHSIRYVDTIRIKGKTEEMPIFELVWDELGATITTGTTTPAGPPSTIRLTLQWQDTRFVVTRDKPVLVIGRDPAVDVCIPSPRISRLHARIEWIKGQLVLSDTSSNGLRLQPADGPERFLHRQDAMLHGQGHILLDLEADNETALVYAIDTTPCN